MMRDQRVYSAGAAAVKASQSQAAAAHLISSGKTVQAALALDTTVGHVLANKCQMLGSILTNFVPFLALWDDPVVLTLVS